MNSPNTPNATFSLESAAGPTRSDSPAGPTTNPSGPVPARASRSPKQAKGKWIQTSATYGPLFEPPSPSADLQSSLENRLRQRMDAYGSPEYALTWKHWDMPSGPPICAQRASPRRIEDNGCTGWRTPTTGDASRGAEKNPKLRNAKAGEGSLINQVKRLVGWVSPTAMDGRRGVKPPRPHDTGIPLSQQIALVLGWSTPTAITNTGGAALCKWGGTASRAKLREAVGNTVLNGALNPAFPCWLMGFPPAWLSCAASAMPSSRSSPRNSSKLTAKAV